MDLLDPSKFPQNFRFEWKSLRYRGMRPVLNLTAAEIVFPIKTTAEVERNALTSVVLVVRLSSRTAF